MKKIKNECFNDGILIALAQLGSLPIPPVTSVKISRLSRIIDGHFKDYEKARQVILKEHFEPIPEKEGHVRIKADADKETVQKIYDDLMSVEFELPAEFDNPILLNFSKWDTAENGRYDLPPSCFKSLEALGLVEVK